jgi:hypothetical protein
MSVKPYFRSENASNNEPDELKAPLPTSELTLEPTEPAEPTIPPLVKRGRGRPRKNPVTESHLTSVDTPIKELPPMDISVLIQEALFIDS